MLIRYECPVEDLLSIDIYKLSFIVSFVIEKDKDQIGKKSLICYTYRFFFI